MDTLWTIALIVINSTVLILCIMSFKSIRTNRLLNKAENSSEEGNKPQALSYLDRALKFSPQNITAISKKAVLLRDMDKYNEAIECYNKALVLAQDKDMLATIYYHLGALYCNMGKYDDAKLCYNNALSNDNIKNDEFWNNFGILHYQMNNKDEALDCFNKALLIKSDSKLARKNKETLLIELENNG